MVQKISEENAFIAMKGKHRYKDLISTLLLLIITLSSFSLKGQINPNPSAVIDNFIQTEMAFERFPGVSTVIVKNGEIVWIESYGYADIENNTQVEDTTIFLLASLSKVFTGTAIMQLKENGTVNFDNDVNDILSWDADIPGFTTDSVTIRQLMTHTASINDGAALDSYYGYPDPTISLADCMQRYFASSGIDYDAEDNFLTKKPGSFYQYSNAGSALVGYLSEVASGMAFDQLCKRQIFEPLEMSNTAWFMADLDSNHVARPYQYQSGSYMPYNHYGFADYPNGQLRSNVKDLANFMIAYLNGGMFGDKKLLSSTSISEMWSSQIPSLEPTQGLSWYQEEFSLSEGGSTMLWGHNGGEDGVSTEMYMDPDNEIGICVLTNGEGDAFSIIEELYNQALTLSTTTSNLNLESNALTIHPNPASGYFSIKGLTNNYDIQILNSMGQIVQSINSAEDVTVDITDLSSGLFFISVKNKTNSKVWLQLILKE